MRMLRALARWEKEPVAKSLRAQADRAIREKYERENRRKQ